MSKSDVFKMALLVAYVLGFFLTWTYLIAYSWYSAIPDLLFITSLFGWLPSIFWPLIVVSLAWVHFWFL